MPWAVRVFVFSASDIVTSVYAARCGLVACDGLRGHANVVASACGLVGGFSVDDVARLRVNAR
jgi:hypothetical protein